MRWQGHLDFGYAAFLQNVHSTVWPLAPADSTWPGDSGFPGTAGINGRYNQFAPRLGLAWDPDRQREDVDSRVVRVSYDITGSNPVNSETSPPFRAICVVGRRSRTPATKEPSVLCRSGLWT